MPREVVLKEWPSRALPTTPDAPMLLETVSAITGFNRPDLPGVLHSNAHFLVTIDRVDSQRKRAFLHSLFFADSHGGAPRNDLRQLVNEDKANAIVPWTTVKYGTQ